MPWLSRIDEMVDFLADDCEYERRGGEKMLKKILFRAAKAPCMGKMVGQVFRYGSWLLPVKKLYLSQDTIAFPHPHPSYDNHIILSPRRAVPNLLALSTDGQDLAGIWKGVQSLREAHAAFQHSFTLVANGGLRQEVQQLHFHLFTRPVLVREWTGNHIAMPVLYSNEQLHILRHPEPQYEQHFILQPVTQEMRNVDTHFFSCLLQCLRWLNDGFSLAQKGYSLIYQFAEKAQNNEQFIFHVISGKRLHIE